jgi:hypothetical protein
MDSSCEVVQLKNRDCLLQLKILNQFIQVYVELFTPGKYTHCSVRLIIVSPLRTATEPPLRLLFGHTIKVHTLRADIRLISCRGALATVKDRRARAAAAGCRSTASTTRLAVSLTTEDTLFSPEMPLAACSATAAVAATDAATSRVLV